MSFEVEDGVRVRLSRRVAAPPERVFGAFVDPDRVSWMWAGLGENPTADIDLRVGGRYRIAIEPAEGHEGWNGGDMAFSGVYVEIVPNRRLVYTLHWEADVGYNSGPDEVLDEAVIVDLAADGDGTLLTMQHVGIPDDGMSAAEHGRGIEQSLDLLASLLESP